jgi:RNA polymerase sigma-70 factor (ECF subfamily)
MATTPDSLPDLDAYRSYLVVLARGRIPRSMQARLDASDIVQETLLEAHRKREQFAGGNEQGKLASWLRQLLSFNLMDAMRTQQRGRRDVRLELEMRKSLDESAIGLENLLVADDTSPSIRVDRHAQVLRLANAIETLPEHQQVAILMRY